MSMVTSREDGLGNHRSIQLSYGVGSFTGRKSAVLEGIAHTLPTPNNPPDKPFSPESLPTEKRNVRAGVVYSRPAQAIPSAFGVDASKDSLRLGYRQVDLLLAHHFSHLRFLSNRDNHVSEVLVRADAGSCSAALDVLHPKHGAIDRPFDHVRQPSKNEPSTKPSSNRHQDPFRHPPILLSFRRGGNCTGVQR